MADDHIHEFPEQAKPLGDEKSSSGTADEPEINPEDYYRAYDERMAFVHASDHWQICRWLNIAYDSVTAEDLARASVSNDVQTQAVRLRPLFEMCGLVGEAYSMERADLIQRLAEAGPQSSSEMQILSQAIATEYMAARCAADAMRQGQSVEVMSLQLGNFSKASKLGTQLREAQHKLWEAARPSLRLLDASPHAAIGHTKSLPAGEAAPDRQGDTGETGRG
jgi:hypothetical protein